RAETYQAESQATAHALKAAAQPNYLGNYKVVNGLLRKFIHDALTGGHEDDMGAWAEPEALRLADIFLGKDPAYPGPKWFSVGLIDEHLAIRGGTDSDDPRKRVGGALIQMLTEIGELAVRIGADKLLNEQWQPAASEIVNRWTDEFLGLPPTI